MKNYLALIRKADFNDLYRYGYIRIREQASVEFTCSLDELPSHSDVFLELARNANEFDNAFVYLLIHYTIDDEAPKTEVHIQDVQHIYPLDYESQREFATSFDERIQISAPIWNEAVVELQESWTVQSCLNGARNIWRIFDIKYPIENVRQIITDELVKKIVHLLYSNQEPYGELPLTIYLLRYERHSYYSKKSRGFFMDAVHAFCNYRSKGAAPQESVENTGAYKVLSKKIKDDDRYPVIIDKCGKEETFAAFLKALENECPDYSYIEVAPLFLFLRAISSDGIKEDYMKLYNDLKSYTSEENYAIAMYLLGIVLGHEKTYDALYDAIPLAIYKPKVVKEPVVEKTKPKASRKGSSSKNTTKKSASKPVAKQEIVAGVPMEITPPPVEPIIADTQEMITIQSSMNENPLTKDVASEEQPTSSLVVDLLGTTINFPFYMGKRIARGKNKGKIDPKTIVKVTEEDEFKLWSAKGYEIDNNNQ